MKQNKSNYNGYTESRKQCNARYRKSKATITIILPNELKSQLDEYVKKTNTSINKLVTSLITDTILK